MQLFKHAYWVFLLVFMMVLFASSAQAQPPKIHKNTPKPSQQDYALCDQYIENFFIGKKSKEPLIGKGYCGSAPVYEVSGAVVFDKKIDLPKPIKLNCMMLIGLKPWFESIFLEGIKYFNSYPNEVQILSSYVCRNRYNNPRARISEHAFANAVDIMGFSIANGENISVLSDWHKKTKKGKFLNAAHHQGCDNFATVLGPNANSAHRNHFHFDMGRKGPRAKYRVCK